MMESIETIVERTLYLVGIDAYYLYRPNELEENAVFTYTMKTGTYSDNKLLDIEYTALINTYVKLERDINNVRNKILEAMSEQGFSVEPIPSPRREGDFINIALRFKKKIKIG